VLVAGLAQPLSIGPAFSDDALTVLYVSNNPYDIFVATRPDRDSPLSSGVPLASVNHAGIDATPFLADGGLTLLFASDRGTQPGFNDLMIATSTSLNENFSAPAPIANVNSSGIELLPHQSNDGLRLYFSSDRVGGNREIWLSTRPDRSAAFSTPSPVAGLNGNSAEFGPTLGTDELEAFFASDRPGGQGSMDVWRAVRNGREAAFDTPENVTVLNGPGYDTDPRLSTDGTELFYSSSRNDSQVLWSARRACVTVVP
jgi:Tol biopolymer transport system component